MVKHNEFESESDDIRVAVMDALTDTKLLATLAEWVADGVFDWFEKQMSGYEDLKETTNASKHENKK